jgi:hypothetical protein
MLRLGNNIYDGSKDDSVDTSHRMPKEGFAH